MREIPTPKLYTGGAVANVPERASALSRGKDFASMRYPQAIPGNYGLKCPYCGRKKYQYAKTCKFCDPCFSSFSKATEWAEKKEAGPCVLVHRQHGYRYTEWPRRPEGR